jgi:hypothetical protein
VITDQYKDQLKLMADKNTFKGKSNFYDEIKQFISERDPSSILDFGCAQGNLIELIKKDFSNILIDGYDPGVAKFSIAPTQQYDCLVSNDVLEHIEPAHLDETLRKIDDYFTKSAWLIIACYPAKKHLPDRRNAHLIVNTPAWWIDKISTIMIKSKISKSEIVIKNPDTDILNKKTKQIIIPKGNQIELWLIMEK